jgi:hypothetical protein
MAKAAKKPRVLAPGEKPDLPALDPLEAAQAAARNAQEGNVKLARVIDALREGLEVIAVAEWDHQRNSPVAPSELRAMAIGALDRMSSITGQGWRRNPIVKTRVGDKSISAAELADE